MSWTHSLAGGVDYTARYIKPLSELNYLSLQVWLECVLVFSSQLLLIVQQMQSNSLLVVIFLFIFSVASTGLLSVILRLETTEEQFFNNSSIHRRGWESLFAGYLTLRQSWAWEMWCWEAGELSRASVSGMVLVSPQHGLSSSLSSAGSLSTGSWDDSRHLYLYL